MTGTKYWEDSLQGKFLGWADPTNLEARRDYCLGVLNSATGMGAPEIYNLLITDEAPAYALQSADFNLFFTMIKRILAEAEGELSSLYFDGDVRGYLMGCAGHIMGFCDVVKLQAFVSSAIECEIPKSHILVPLHGGSVVTPEILTLLEERKGEVTFELYSDYFEGHVWRWLGWEDYIRTLRLPEPEQVARVIERCPEKNYDLSSLALLCIGGKIDDEILSCDHQNLAIAKYLSYSVCEAKVSTLARSWIEDVGASELSKTFASAMKVAHFNDHEYLCRGLSGIMMILGGADHLIIRSATKRHRPLSQFGDFYNE